MDPKKKKQEKLLRQQELMKKAKEELRDLNAEEKAEFDALQEEIEALDRQISEGNGEEEKLSDSPDGMDNLLEKERQRSAEIFGLCRSFGMEPEPYIREGKSVDQVREAVIEKLRKDNAPVHTRGTGGVNVTEDEGDKFRRAAADAILMRGGIEIARPEPGASELRSLSLRDLAIESMQKEGIAGLNRKSSDELFDMLGRAYYNPTAAFPAIMDTAINKAFVEGHKTVNTTFDRFCKKGTLKDFKIHDNNYLAGPAGEFLEVPEGGELKQDLPSTEKMPVRKLHTYGRQFTMTREAFINDDIDVVTSLPAKYAASSKKTINKQVYAIMCNNPAIYDGTELFSADHRNLLATGTGVTRESLQKMIMALQTQTNQFGEAIIINPATLVVPAGYAFDTYTLLYSPTINTSSNTQAVNPMYRYRESIEVVEDPAINVLCGGFGKVMPWFLVGSRSDTDFIEVDYLNGQEIPKIRRMETPGQLGFVWDVYLDWGVAVMDYRGCIKNPGIAVNSPLM